jgi:hypothetical protein
MKPWTICSTPTCKTSTEYAPLQLSMPNPGSESRQRRTCSGASFTGRVIAREGPTVGPDAERIPVVRIGLSGNTTPKSLILQMLEFFAHPKRSGTTLEVTSSALDCALRCETQLIIIDDIHFLNLHRRDGREVSNTLKSLANDFPRHIYFRWSRSGNCGLVRGGP